MDPKYEKLSPTTSGQVEPSIVSCLSNVKQPSELKHLNVLRT